MKLSSLKYQKGNPRIIKDERFEKLKKSIEEFPKMLELRPMIYNPETMEVMGGNMRLKALRELGHKEIPDSWLKSAESLTEDERKRFIIVDNVGFGEWDWEILEDDWDSDELTDWGLELDGFEDVEELEPGEEQTETPEAPTEPETVLGDLYELNDHRVHCASSTEIDAVEKLMNREKCELLFTDPPYNVSFNGRSGKHDLILNDNLSESDFDDFINDTIGTIKYLNPDNYYIWCNWNFYGILQGKLDYKSCIVWAKNCFGMGNGYRHQHEFCLFNGKIDEDIKNESDLWEEKKDSKYVHPTQKPTALSERALKNHKLIKIIVDLFLGSGSSLIGAEISNKNCYGQELDPKYCDVIVKRWVNYMRDNNRPFTVKRNGKDITNEDWLLK